jgi:hypothetical protein
LQHWILQVYRTVYGFGYSGDTREDVLKYFRALNHPTYVTQNAFYATTRITMDALMVSHACVFSHKIQPLSGSRGRYFGYLLYGNSNTLSLCYPSSEWSATSVHLGSF